MSNRTDIVVETDNAEGRVLLSASRVYDLTEDKTQDTINGEIKNTLNSVSDDVAPIKLTGTNTTGSTIKAGIFFYNNGVLVRAKTDIQNGSAITIGTNTDTVTAGGLNALNNMFDFTAYSGRSTADSSLPSGITRAYGSFGYSLNADKTFGALYCALAYNVEVGTTKVNLHIPLGFSVKSIGAAHSIFLGNAYSYTWDAITGQVNVVADVDLRIEANGDAYLNVANVYNNSSVITRLFVSAPFAVYPLAVVVP